MQFPESWVAEARLRPGKVRFIVPEISPNCKCLNCGDLRSVYKVLLTGGPFTFPSYSGTSRYIDDGSVPEGWYTSTTEGAPCPVCASLDVSRAEKLLLELSGLDEEDLELGFGNFWGKDGKERAKATLQQVVASPKPAGYITLWGKYGVGKTFLMKIAVNQLRQSSVQAAYRTTGTLLAECRGEDKDADALIAKYSSIQALFLDEVDRLNPTPWAQEVVFRLLNNRYVRRDSRLTVLATNNHPDALENIFEYLASRMNDGEVIEVTGDDMRGLSHKQRDLF